MKRFTTILCALALLFGVVGEANAALKEYEIDEKFTSISDLTGKAFYIVNETDGKALYGTNNQNLGYDVYGAAINASNSGYTWKIEASLADGCYRFRLQTPTGDPYSVWSNPGYLNTNGSNAFVLGLQGTAASPREGQDIENGAAWIVAPQSDGTFTLESKGAAGKYLKDASGTNTTATKFTFCTLKEVVSSDPLASDKADLQDAIDLGNLQNAFGKTAASFQVLTDAIAAGEAEVVKNSPETDATKLGNCKQAILDAIAGFVLEDGYTNLTADMYKQWNDNYTPTTPTNVGCNYHVNESTGQPYGDGSVRYLNFADVSDFSKLIIVGTDGTPRIMMNRLEVGNGGGDGNGGSYVEIKDAFVSGKKEVDLTAYAYAHINAIKGANYANVTVTDMLLYRTVSVTDAGFATFGSLYKSAKLKGTKSYAAVYNSTSGKIELTEVTNVPAGKGVIVEAAEGSYAPTFDVTAADIESDLKVSNGAVTGDGSTIYALGKKGSAVGFIKVKSGSKIPAGKAYLVVSGGGAREFIGFGDDATGIEAVKQETKANNEYFNLAGQRVAQPTKGLYIVNGKKVIVK